MSFDLLDCESSGWFILIGAALHGLVLGFFCEALTESELVVWKSDMMIRISLSGFGCVRLKTCCIKL
jgi:hypothetical protein